MSSRKRAREPKIPQVAVGGMHVRRGAAGSGARCIVLGGPNNAFRIGILNCASGGNVQSNGQGTLKGGTLLAMHKDPTKHFGNPSVEFPLLEQTRNSVGQLYVDNQLVDLEAIYEREKAHIEQQAASSSATEVKKENNLINIMSSASNIAPALLRVQQEEDYHLANVEDSLPSLKVLADVKAGITINNVKLDFAYIYEKERKYVESLERGKVIDLMEKMMKDSFAKMERKIDREIQKTRGDTFEFLQMFKTALVSTRESLCEYFEEPEDE